MLTMWWCVAGVATCCRNRTKEVLQHSAALETELERKTKKIEKLEVEQHVHDGYHRFVLLVLQDPAWLRQTIFTVDGHSRCAMT